MRHLKNIAPLVLALSQRDRDSVAGEPEGKPDANLNLTHLRHDLQRQAISDLR